MTNILTAIAMAAAIQVGATAELNEYEYSELTNLVCLATNGIICDMPEHIIIHDDKSESDLMELTLDTTEPMWPQAVRQLGKAGEICKVYGHRWKAAYNLTVYTTYPPIEPPDVRYCTVCDIKQEKKPETWETAK
jgi:hypothetical protein